MKMRKLVLNDYEIEVKMPDGSAEKKNYRVVESIASVLFHPELKLDSRSALKAGQLADRIEGCAEEFIMLTEEEFSQVDKAFKAVTGFSRNDLELVRRVTECEEVEVKVEEAKKEKS